MKKKIILIVSICLMLFTLTACEESDPKTADYNGHSYDELNQVGDVLFQALGSLSEEEIASYEQGEDALQRDMVQTYEDTIAEAGAIQEVDEDCTITKSGKTLTVEKMATCEKRQIKMVLVYDYNDITQPTAVTVESIYTLGEKMAQAGKNTIIGILVVFSILVLISLIIRCFTVIPYLQEKFAKKKELPEAQAPVASQTVEEPAEDEVDDAELVAVIAAAIAAATDTPVDGFVVRSIKRRK